MSAEASPSGGRRLLSRKRRRPPLLGPRRRPRRSSSRMKRPSPSSSPRAPKPTAPPTATAMVTAAPKRSRSRRSTKARKSRRTSSSSPPRGSTSRPSSRSATSRERRRRRLRPSERRYPDRARRHPGDAHRPAPPRPEGHRRPALQGPRRDERRAALRVTTMDPASRTLMQVKIEDAVKADRMFTMLMGDARRAAPRVHRAPRPRGAHARYISAYPSPSGGGHETGPHVLLLQPPASGLQPV